MALRQILDHLGSISALLDGYEPPSPSAVFSPNTSELRGRIHHQLADVYQKASGARLFGDGPGNRRASQDEEHNIVRDEHKGQQVGQASNAPRQNVQRKDKDEERLRKRGDAILEAYGKEALPPQDLISVALGQPGPPKRCQTSTSAEDAALKRLLRGYAHASEDIWKSLLAPHSSTMPTGYTSTIAASSAYDGVVDILLRLEMRHTTNEAHTNACINHVLSQIETIKFAKDWKARSAQSGGKAWIAKFYETVFQDDPQYKPRFDGLRFATRQEKLETLAPEFKKWKKDNEPLVTARNRLLKLYDTFGVAVLVDPTWSVDGLVKNRSGDFSPLMQYLYTHIPVAHAEDGVQQTSALVPLQVETIRAVLRIVEAFGGPDVVRHVSQFLEAHPPAFEL